MSMLQPENILCLTESGNRIKIIDFGLAREYDPSTKLQVLFGTPEFGNIVSYCLSMNYNKKSIFSCSRGCEL